MSYQDQNSHVAYQQAPKPPTNGLTIACLILGILALVIGIWSLVPFIGIVAAAISFLPALFAVIFGHVGLRAYRTVGVGRGQAVTGLVLGYATLGIIVGTTLFWVITISTSETSIIA